MIALLSDQNKTQPHYQGYNRQETDRKRKGKCELLYCCDDIVLAGIGTEDADSIQFTYMHQEQCSIQGET